MGELVKDHIGRGEASNEQDELQQATLLEHWFFGFHLNLLSSNIPESA